MRRTPLAAAVGDLVDRAGVGAAGGGAQASVRPVRGEEALPDLGVGPARRRGGSPSVCRLVSPPRMTARPALVASMKSASWVEVVALQALVLGGAAGLGVQRVDVDLDRRSASVIVTMAKPFMARQSAAPPSLVSKPPKQPVHGTRVLPVKGRRDRTPRPSPTNMPAGGGVEAGRLGAGVLRRAVLVGGLRPQALVVVDEVELVEHRHPPVEVLLREHDVVLVQQRADERDVLLRVLRRDLLRQPGDVVAQHAERAARGPATRPAGVGAGGRRGDQASGQGGPGRVVRPWRVPGGLAGAVSSACPLVPP